jgi:ssDNA-binding replication factor A large subunit
MWKTYKVTPAIFLNHLRFSYTNMQVKDIKAKGPVDEITLTIDSIDEPRNVRDGGLTVANAQASDATGSITLTLWNDDVNKVKTGDSIKITKGWVGEYQGKFQLSAGKFGKMEILGSKPVSAKAPKKNSKVEEAIDEDII